MRLNALFFSNLALGVGRLVRLWGVHHFSSEIISYVFSIKHCGNIRSTEKNILLNPYYPVVPAVDGTTNSSDMTGFRLQGDVADKMG